MIGLINQIGPAGWPLVLIALFTVILFVKNAIALFGHSAGKSVTLGSLSFLGNLGLSLGAFSTLLGIHQGLQIFSMLSPDQVASGLSRALPALLFGLLIHMLASVFRFVLRLGLNKRAAGAA